MGKIYSFKFSETQLAPSSQIYQPAVKETSAPSEESKLSAGTIEVKIYEAVKNPIAELKVFTPSSKGLPTENKKIDKDKKFWAQPSVTTACADEGRPAKAQPPHRSWIQVSNVPVFTFTGYYHTPGVIKILRNIERSSSISSPSINAGIPSSSPSSPPVAPKREMEVIDLTGDEYGDKSSSSTSKKRRRFDGNSSIII